MITLIIIIYGTILLAIGIYSSLRIKTPDDYYVAGKKNGVLQISGSLTATILGGSAILGSVNLAMEEGWAAAWYLLSASIGLWILLPMVKKVNHLGRYTLTDMIGHFYGNTARKTASVIIPIAWTGIVSAQIIAASKILFSIFSLPYEYGVLISGTVFILYTLIGGQISILKTDFFQSIVIIFGITICAIFLTGNSEITVPQIFETFPFNTHFSFIDLIILLLTFSSTFVVGPDIYSRLFCAKNAKTARHSIIIVATILIPFAFILTYLGIIAADNLPAETIKNSVALVELMKHYLSGWMVGLIAAALLSAVLSSADTTLLTASIILSEFRTNDIDNKNSLKRTKIIIIITGVISMLISLKISSIIGMLLLALTFYSGAFIIPLIAALTGLKINKKMSVPAMIVGGIVALTGKLIFSIGHLWWGNWIIIVAFAINFILLKTHSKKTLNNLTI
ncbi:MAG: sodium:solute symporter family protein [Prolixibacteraceae bacterium]|nr:sodium:solute symporter family protein [Prolixibacteraceae bacterium]